MITRRELRAALRKITDADWAIAERTRRVRLLRGTLGDSAVAEAHATQLQFTTTLHRDFPLGRGSAQSRFSADSFTSQGVVAALAQACTEQVQPPWRMAPPSAAAQVRLDDAALREATVLAHIRDAMQSTQTAATIAKFDRLHWQVALADEAIVVETSTGNEIRWTATDVQLAITAQRGSHSLETHRCARQRNAVEPAQLYSELDQDLAQLASATATPRGLIAMVLGREAMLFDGDLGVWRILAEQAKLQRFTRGVARLPATLPNATLRVLSDGARSFGWRSAPIADDGAPVRRFVLLANGAVVSRGSTVIDAGQNTENGQANANGGVRNLDVSDTGPAWQPPSNFLEVHRLESPRLDLASGWLTALIASATWYRGDTKTPVTGGAIRVDLVNALLAGHPHGAAISTASYQGPSQLVLGVAAVY